MREVCYFARAEGFDRGVVELKQLTGSLTCVGWVIGRQQLTLDGGKVLGGIMSSTTATVNFAGLEVRRRTRASHLRLKLPAGAVVDDL